MVEQSNVVKNTLSKPEVHEGWEKIYRTQENERFWNMLFDWIIHVINLPKNSKVLDVGCGIGQHSARLAKNGFQVIASDFSEDRVNVAKANIAAQSLNEKVQFACEDLTNLSFGSESFDCVLCWGVLMHIPEVEQAMSELTRVVKVGGKLIIYEDNLYSVDTVIQRIGVKIKQIIGRAGTKRSAMGVYGLESWVETNAGEIIIRQSKINAMKNFFELRGFKTIAHNCGQFTELYRLIPNAGIGKLVINFLHSINWFWFDKISSSFLSYGNIIIFEKQIQSYL